MVVVNMLITGFDAPIEQVIYLDRIIKEHNLLQAIARVNRVSDESKEKGFVVDYVGVGHHLKAAIDNYDEREQKEIIDTIGNLEAELNQLKANHQAIKDLLAQYGLTNLNDLHAFYDLFYDEDIRFQYILAFRQLTTSLNQVFPRQEALEYWSDYQALASINAQAASHLNDQRLSMIGIPAKLRQITDQYLASVGIEPKVEPISILDDGFEQQVGKAPRPKTRAAAVEHAIRHHLEINFADDPEFYASLAEALERILLEFMDNWEKIYQELEKLRQTIKKRPPPPGNLHPRSQMPIFRILAREIFDCDLMEQQLEEGQQDQLVLLTSEIYDLLKVEIALVGFWQKIPAQNNLKQSLLKLLLQYRSLPNVMPNRNPIISRLMELAQANHDTILYA